LHYGLFLPVKEFPGAYARNRKIRLKTLKEYLSCRSPIALIHEHDLIFIDISGRTLNLIDWQGVASENKRMSL